VLSSTQMPRSPQSLSLAPGLPLKYVGGDPSLDLVNTVDWTAAGLENDRLVDYPRLVEWAGGAGIIDRSGRARLLEIARDRPHAARSAYEHARWARWVLQRFFASVAARNASADALEDINRLLRDAGQHLRLAYAGRGPVALEWRADRADDLDVVLWAVARSAATLLESELSQLRVCAGPDCGWMYVDRSRNGLRRWCEMQTCGTRAKSRRRAARAATSPRGRRKGAQGGIEDK
jgi:predicted RNA-binding Zn ribbon-like protein